MSNEGCKLGTRICFLIFLFWARVGKEITQSNHRALIKASINRGGASRVSPQTLWLKKKAMQLTAVISAISLLLEQLRETDRGKICKVKISKLRL